ANRVSIRPKAVNDPTICLLNERRDRFSIFCSINRCPRTHGSTWLKPRDLFPNILFKIPFGREDIVEKRLQWATAGVGRGISPTGVRRTIGMEVMSSAFSLGQDAPPWTAVPAACFW